MNRDRQDEEGARNISHLNQPALREARWVGPNNLALRHPVERYQEAERLQEIGQNELINEYDRLISTNGADIVGFPVDHAPRDEAQKRSREEQRDRSETAYSQKSVIDARVHGQEAVRRLVVVRRNSIAFRCHVLFCWSGWSSNENSRDRYACDRNELLERQQNEKR